MGLFLEDYTPRITFTRPRVRPNMRQILADVADRYGVWTADLQGPSRRQCFVVPRHEFMYLAHKVHGYSLPHVGDFLDRDHTTILHGCEMHLCRQEPGYVPYKPRFHGRQVAA